MVEEGSRDTALDAAAQRTLETRLGAAARMRTARVQQAAPSRCSPNRCHSHAARKPCAASRRRGGARGREPRAARQARVSCGEERRRRRRRGRSGMVQTAEEAGPSGRRGALVRRQAATKEWRGQAMVQRGQARRASCARLSRRLGLPTEDPRRGQSAACGSMGARTRDTGSGGMSGRPAVRPRRWRRPNRCCCHWKECGDGPRSL